MIDYNISFGEWSEQSPISFIYTYIHTYRSYSTMGEQQQRHSDRVSECSHAAHWKRTIDCCQPAPPWPGMPCVISRLYPAMCTHWAPFYLSTYIVPVNDIGTKCKKKYVYVTQQDTHTSTHQYDCNHTMHLTAGWDDDGDGDADGKVGTRKCKSLPDHCLLRNTALTSQVCLLEVWNFIS